ncbi:response regulator [Oscillatoriales cyanobacterium LEGE 11467]|uniref:Response regulator n=1 Tax=Zarconia navalis LEGE 11467 TaxID=1828826 RepID=A0A928VY41_9CYAN|nr:response regulator [Zarconia navalis]MBE9042327.1 response regulator [Zarconia navalis LEGE 11467]
MSDAAILCVDDEATILKSLEIELQDAFGDMYLYEFAESADEALEIIEEFGEDDVRVLILVSDWLMPGMKGDEFLIKVHQIKPEIIKVMLTGQADEDAIERAKSQANLYQYLQKPWKNEELIETIRSALSQT